MKKFFVILILLYATSTQGQDTIWVPKKGDASKVFLSTIRHDTIAIKTTAFPSILGEEGVRIMNEHKSATLEKNIDINIFGVGSYDKYTWNGVSWSKTHESFSFFKEMGLHVITLTILLILAVFFFLPSSFFRWMELVSASTMVVIIGFPITLILFSVNQKFTTPQEIVLLYGFIIFFVEWFVFLFLKRNPKSRKKPTPIP